MKKSPALIISFLAIISLPTQALVTCTPTSCSPACDSSCSYQACDKVQTHVFDVKKLEIETDDDPSSACEHDKVLHRQVPFNVDGTSYGTIPASVTHRYKICDTKVIYGPPCPPPTKTPSVTP